MLFPQVYSFLLAGSFQFSFCSALSSAHFIYRLPCYPRLPIFNRVLSYRSDFTCILSFRYMLANSFFAFLSFKALVLVGIFLLYLEAVFTSAHFFLTANVSYGTRFSFCLVGMYSAAACKWALTKFSFGVCVSVFSCSASNFFLRVNAYLSLISVLLSKDQS